jgi:hypothetical protein
VRRVIPEELDKYSRERKPEAMTNMPNKTNAKYFVRGWVIEELPTIRL